MFQIHIAKMIFWWHYLPDIFKTFQNFNNLIKMFFILCFTYTLESKQYEFRECLQEGNIVTPHLICHNQLLRTWKFMITHLHLGRQWKPFAKWRPKRRQDLTVLSPQKLSRVAVMQWQMLSIASVLKCTQLWHPDQWIFSIIVPLPKKDDLRLMTNYRGISLLSIAAKVYNKNAFEQDQRWGRSHSEEQPGWIPSREKLCSAYEHFEKDPGRL